MAEYKVRVKYQPALPGRDRAGRQAFLSSLRTRITAAGRARTSGSPVMIGAFSTRPVATAKASAYAADPEGDAGPGVPQEGGGNLRGLAFELPEILMGEDKSQAILPRSRKELRHGRSSDFLALVGVEDRRAGAMRWVEVAPPGGELRCPHRAGQGSSPPSPRDSLGALDGERHLLDEGPDSSNSRLAEGARLPELFQCDNSMA